MNKQEKIQMARVIVCFNNNFRKFLPNAQLLTIRQLLGGEEGEWFADKVIALKWLIEEMPVTYQQDGKGDDAVVHLHYFMGGIDVWVTEKDIEDGVTQAFGFVNMGDPQNAELGYVSITEITEAGMELDLHWEPKTLRQVKQEIWL